MRDQYACAKEWGTWDVMEDLWLFGCKGIEVSVMDMLSHLKLLQVNNGANSNNSQPTIISRTVTGDGVLLQMSDQDNCTRAVFILDTMHLYNLLLHWQLIKRTNASLRRSNYPIRKQWTYIHILWYAFAGLSALFYSFFVGRISRCWELERTADSLPVCPPLDSNRVSIKHIVSSLGILRNKTCYVFS